MNTVLFVVLALIATALVLNIFIKLDRQHPDLIRNGFFAAVVIVLIFFSNSYFTRDNFETSFVVFDSTVEAE